MKKAVILIALIGAMISNASTLNVVEEKSNSYFKAISDVLFFGSDEIIGVNKKLAGTIVYENDKINGGQITIYANGFDTQNNRRDKHIYEILNANTYPEITFSIEKQFMSNNQQFIKGVLKINGIEKTKEIPVKISFNNGEVKVVGKIDVKYKDFGMKLPSVGGFIKKANESIEIGGQFIFSED